jgi:hypothetical protein
MDIGKFNTKAGAAKGAFMHLLHPAFEHPLYDGEGADSEGRLMDADKATAVGFTVLGTESRYAQNRARELQRSRLKGKHEKAGSAEDDEQDGMAFVCALITELHGMTRDGEPMEATEENKMYVLEQSEAFVQQVLEFAQDRANFYKAASKG